MNNTLKSLQKYNANHQNLTPRNKPILTQNEYLQSVNKLNTILNSLKIEEVPVSDLPVSISDLPVSSDPQGYEVPEQENETQPKTTGERSSQTPRKRRTKKEIELDLYNIAQKQKDYIVEHPPIPPSKPIKPTRPKAPAKIITSTIGIAPQSIASVKK